jgi:hypothetical protein
LSVTELQFSGYIFLEFSNHQNAAEAVAATNNLKLDKQHTFTVNLFSGTYVAFIFALLQCSNSHMFLGLQDPHPAVLRIRDVYPGSRFFLSIPDPRSRIPDLGSKNLNKREG